jgi:hypothetical protein
MKPKPFIEPLPVTDRAPPREPREGGFGDRGPRGGAAGGFGGAAIDEGEAQRLALGQAGQARLLDGRDVNEHVFAEPREGGFGDRGPRGGAAGGFGGAPQRQLTGEKATGTWPRCGRRDRRG